MNDETLAETKCVLAAWKRGAVDANTFFDWLDDMGPALVAEVESLRERLADQEHHGGQALHAWEETKAELRVVRDALEGLLMELDAETAGPAMQLAIAVTDARAALGDRSTQ